MRKQKSRQKAPLLTRILSFLLVASMMLSMNAGIVIYAAAESVDTSHRLQNGSFEMNQTWEGPYKQVNQNTVPYWNTTAIDERIELLHENTGTYIDNVKVTPSDRLLAAELNADEESTLYQDIKTFPASVYKWGLDHGARNGTDTMALVIGPTQSVAPSKPEKNGRDQFMQMIDWLIAQNLTSIKTEAGLGEQLTVYSKKFDENGTFADNAGNNAFSLTPSTIYTEEWHIWIMASSKTTTDSVNPWYSYGENGDISSNSADPEGEIGLDTDKYYLYTVPEGQTETTFAFVSVGVYQSPVTAEKAKTYGNFLDNINFEIYYPLSGSTTTHGSAVVSDSGGSTEGEVASDGYKITVDDQLATYITDGKTLKIQAVVKKEDADNSCAFVGVYCTTRDEDDNPVTKFIQTANNSNWERTVNGNGDIIYTYYIENITSPIDLHFIFIKNPTITYDPNGGLPYIAESEYNTTEADNVYSFKPAVNQNAGEGESATIFIPPYTSHAATGQNDGWKFTGWLLTGDSTTETPPEELGRLILPAEHTVACDYDLSHASSENAAQYFKVYDGNIHLTESIQNNDGVPSGVVWEDNGESIAYGNIHNGLTMIAQWRWRQAFVPQVNRNESYVDSAAGGTVSIRYDESNAEHYDASYNEHGGKAYYAQTNETVTATAAANDGFVFEGWYSASGKLITTNPTYSYTETKESVNTYYARFSDTVRQTYIRQVKNGDTYEITDDDSIATIDRYSYVDSVGKPISATALPTEEYKFDGWYDAEENEVSDDMLINDGMTISYTTTESATYYARFSKKETRPTDRTISAVNYVGVYDGKNHSITVQNATIAGDIIYYSTDNINWSTTKPTRKDVQNEETVFVKVFNPIYKTVEANAYIKITPRPITITVNDAEKNFDTEDPEFTGGITEGRLVKDGDLGEITYYRTNTTDEAVGTYPDVLSAKYSANRNYAVTVVPGDFVIKTSSAAGAALVPTGGVKVYDGSPLYASAKVEGADGYTIYFKVDGGDWTTEATFVTNVSEGEVTVHTKAVKTGYEDLVGEDITIQILPRPITITVNDAEKDFGTEDPEFIGSITEGTLVSADDIGEITYSRSNNAESVGEYPGVLTAGYTANSNYQVTVVPGKFTIKPLTEAGAILTPTGGEKVYDGEPLYASAQVTGAEGYTIYYKTEISEWSTSPPFVTNVSEGKVTVHTKAVKPGYEDLLGDDVTIQITPRPITITVNDAEKDFGDTDPVFTGRITNGTLVDDDDLGDIIYYRVNSDEDVGEYPNVLTARYTQNSNYDVDIIRGNFIIRTSSVTGAVVIPTGGSKVYDGRPLYARAQVVGADGYTIYFRTDDSGWSTEAPFVTNVSEGEVTVYTKAVKPGYADLVGDNVTIQITPRPITITVDDAEKNLGEDDPDFTGNITAGTLVDNDDLGEISFYRTNSDENAGTYPDSLTARYTYNSNYDVVVIRGDFTIIGSQESEARLVPRGGIKVYDGDPLYASAKVVDAEGYTIYFKVDGSDWTTEAPFVTNVSEGEVTVYTKAVKPGAEDLFGDDVTIQITPRPITITVDDAGKNLGEEDPEFTGGITDGTLVDDDDLGGIYFYRTNSDEGVGIYPDTLTARYTYNSNYDVDVVRGDFTIRDSQGTEARLVPRGGAKVYDGTPLYASAQVIGGEGYTIYFKTGDGNWSTEAPFVTNVSEGEVTVHTKAVKAGYDDLIGNDVTIQITPRPVTITVNDAEKDEGEEDPNFTGSITRGSLVDEDDLGEIAYYRVSDDEEAGTYPDVLTARYTHNSNYTVDVIRGDFTINAGSVSEVTLVATGGIKVYDGIPLYARATVIGGEGYTVYFKTGNGDWTTEVPSVTDVADGEVIVQTKAVKDGSEDVFGADVTIKIKPRTIVLTSATDSKSYDETPLTNHNVTVTGDGFVDGEGADYHVTGSQTEVGSSENFFTYELHADTDASNYIITKKEGTLTVTSVQTPDEPEEPDEPDKPSKPPKPSKPARPEKPAQPENPNPPTLTKDHVAYIIGYVDGTVRPNNLITRAEVTTIFFRLLSDESRSEFWSQTNPYSDVSRNLWCNNAISTLTNAGIILGYNDGTFKPDAPITRAQLAAIAVRFSTVIYDGDSTFNDVPSSHWASRYIALAEYPGWINGYRDNTFKPDQYITRAEAITLINRVLERDVEEEYMLPGMITWIDNPPYTWCYEAIQEATNSHDYTRTDKQSPEHDFNYEAWLRINPVPNWAGLEREWSTANSK